MRWSPLVAPAILALSAVAGAVAPAAAAEARRAMDEGLALFAAQGYEAAAGKFAEAAAKAVGEELDPAPAAYDRATALLLAGKSVEAAAVFTEALGTTEPDLRGKAHYNRGMALVTAADAAEREREVTNAIALLDQALGEFESAMRIDPDDEDPKVNHELVFRKKARLEEATGKREQAPQPPPEHREDQGQAARPRGPGREMTPDEARTMLDAMRRREMSQRDRIKPFAGGSAPVEKNW